MNRVVYLGPKGTFTEMAARKRFPDAELQPIPLIRRTIKLVESGQADYGIVPLENLYNGEVRETLDALFEQERTQIIEEMSLQIVHCLGALPKRKAITLIMSKDQAVEQCGKYLERNFPDADIVYTESTSNAVQRIVNERLDYAGAIASKKAIETAGLEVLAVDLCPNNKTRFAVLGRDMTKQTGDDKTLIAISPRIKDKPGVLRDCLGVLADKVINLEYLQSRPDGNTGYTFYLELVGHQKDELISSALDELRVVLNPNGTENHVVKILGSYKNARWKS